MPNHISRSRRLAGIAGSLIFITAVFLFGQHASVRAGSLTFSGTVVLPAGSAYIDGGWISMWKGAGGGGGGSNINSDGSFEITGLDTGVYTVELSLNQASAYANPPQQQVTVSADVTGFRFTVSTPVLRGTLAAPDSTPTNGCVQLRNTTYTVNRWACTDSNNVFKIGALEAGSYILTTQPPENSAHVSGEQTVTVTDPAATLDLGLVKFETPFITGTLALPDGTPLPWSDDWNSRIGASVDLWNTDRTVDRHANYDRNSVFKFGRMPAGTYFVRVNVWNTDLYTSSEQQTWTVPSAGLDLTATPIRLGTPKLAGTVYRPDGATPVPNAWVNLHSEDWSVSQGGNTDQNGKYRIGGLANGTYLLEVNPPQDMTDVVRPEAESVVITDQLVTKNITLTGAKKFVAGVVKRSDGTPVSCAQVNANRMGGNGWANARTQSDGSYTLTLQPGIWSIGVMPSFDYSCAAADWVYADPEAVVEFADSNTTEVLNANLTVQKATAVITGTVKKTDGTPVTNGNVNANSQTPDGRNRWSNTPIGSNGSYTLRLIGGTYDLNIWTNDQSLYTRNQKVTVSDNATVTVNFTMGQKNARIRGKVTDKAGKALGGIQLNGNLDCGPDGCSGWSNTTTAEDGTYSMAVTAGRWNINVDSGRGQRYVYDGAQKEIFLESETAAVDDVNFELTYADAQVRGKAVDETGKTITDLSSWVYVRPVTISAGVPFREFGGPLNGGSFSFYIPSSVYSQVEIGVHTPPNSQYSAKPGQTFTVVADGVADVNVIVLKNDAAIIGRVVNASGLPLASCPFRGEVFANQPSRWYGTQVNQTDCSYALSILSGTYNIGYHFEESAGFLNRPLNKGQVTIAPGERKQFDIPVVAGDAQVKVRVLKPNGEPMVHSWVWMENRQEIEQQMRAGESSQEGQQAFKGPGGTETPKALFKYCSKKENEKECGDFKLPPGSEGPGGCKDALACTKYCEKNPDICQKEFDKDPSAGQSAGPTAQSVNNRRAKIMGLKHVRATAEEQQSEGEDPFANMVSTGGETNYQGVATLTALSGHKYIINAGVPPGTDFMPPKTAEVDLTSTKNAELTLGLQNADGRLSGFVTFNDGAVRDGWVGCWSEDGTNNGSPIQNGTYSLNYVFNTTYHCDANAFSSTVFLRSGEQIISIGTEKKLTKNFLLGAANFEIPPPVSESFDPTQPHVITLGDQTTVNIPANALATSGTVTVTANPTINIQSQVSAKPIGYGYNFEAKDESDKVITTFNSDITMTFTYSQAMLESAGASEDSLVPSYWDSSSGTWKKPTNVTQLKIKDSANGLGSIITTTKHFTAYAVVSSGGKAGKSLIPVSTKKTKKGTAVVIGRGSSARTIIPFSGYKGGLAVQTFVASAKSGQIVVAAPTGKVKGATAAKVIGLNGKVSQTLKLWGAHTAGVSSLIAADVTRDGYDDLVTSASGQSAVTIVDFSKKKNHRVDAGGSGSLRVAALDLGRGPQLVTAAGQSVKVWQFSKSRFAADARADKRKVRVSNSGIERIRLSPVINSVAPKTLKVGKGSAVITIKGEHFGSGSRVLLNGTIAPTKLKAVGETELQATFSLKDLPKKKLYDLQVINADGEQNTRPKVIKTK